MTIHVYKTISGFSGCVILRNGPFKFPTPIVLDRTFLGVKCLKISQKLHENDKNISSYVKNKISQNWQMNYLSPLCQFKLSISQHNLLCNLFPVLLKYITYVKCSGHKPGIKVHAARQWQKGITDILIICQLYSFVIGEWHVLNKLVLQDLDAFFTLKL